MSRAPAVLGLAMLIPVLAGCDYFRPFEKVCEQRLAPASVSVTGEPVTYESDFSLSIAQLSARGAASTGAASRGASRAASSADATGSAASLAASGASAAGDASTGAGVASAVAADSAADASA